MIPVRKIRGLEHEHERTARDFIRDTRPLGEILRAAIGGRAVSVTVLLTLGIMAAVVPGMTPVALFLAGIVYLLRRGAARYDKLPVRIPLGDGVTDYSDEQPDGSFHGGEGIFLVGNERGTGRECWLKRKDLLTHMLVLGTTGSGKTVALTAMAFNALLLGGGFVYTDPKGAPQLWRNIAIMARMLLRDSDLRIVNYMIANAHTSDRPHERLTNTLNPFAYGNADALSQLLVSLIAVSQGDNAVFGQNAQMAIYALMPALVELRDKGEIGLSVETVRDYFTLRKFIELAENTTISPPVLENVRAFMLVLGWQEGVPIERQPHSLPEQFQYARAYFGLTLNSLTYTYGHIYNRAAAEVDNSDVVRNRRILVNVLSSLEKAPAELQQLGKVTLSSIRNSIAIGLGGRVEGRVDDVTESLPLLSPTPFLVITDEYASIPTPGYAEIMTQGRGFGIASVTASQDFDGMARADETGAGQIAENTKVKLGLKIEGQGKTWQLWNGLAGDAMTVQAQEFAVGGRNPGSSLSMRYRDQQSAGISKTQRIEIRDLQEQVEGEYHLFMNGRVVRGKMFYDLLFDSPESVFSSPDRFRRFDLRIVRQIGVPSPDRRDLQMRYGDLKRMTDTILARAEAEDYPPEDARAPDGALGEMMKVFESQGAQDPETRMNTTIRAFLAWERAATETAEKMSAGLMDRMRTSALMDDPKEGGASAGPVAEVADGGDAGLEDLMPSLPESPPVPVVSPHRGGEGPGDEESAPVLEEDTEPSMGIGGMGGLSRVAFWASEGGLNEMEHDVARAEQLMGADPAQAAKNARECRNGVINGLHYPNDPVPKPVADGRAKERLMRSVSRFLD